MLPSAFPQSQSSNDSSKGSNIELNSSVNTDLDPESLLNSGSSLEAEITPNDEYAQLQRRILLFTVILSALAAGITAIFFDFQLSISVLIGSFFGIVYLRLLARSIGRLGKSSKSVSKVQLVIPALLVLAVSKLPELHLLPSLFGFLLYKPSLIIQGLLE